MLSLLVFIRMDWIVQFSLSPFVVNNISLAPKGLKRVHFRTVWASRLAHALCIRHAHKIFVRVWFLFKGSASHAVG